MSASVAREMHVPVHGKSYRVIVTPDMEAGGFTIEVPELPGCISEAETLREARAMAREAIGLILGKDATR